MTQALPRIPSMLRALYNAMILSFPTTSSITCSPNPSTPANGHVRYHSFDSAYSSNTMSDNGPLLFNAINTAASSPSKGHGRSRSQAVSEADSIEEIVENTGVSIEEINSFIGGPNENNRWICLFEGCEKHKSGETFGRKDEYQISCARPPSGSPIPLQAL